MCVDVLHKLTDLFTDGNRDKKRRMDLDHYMVIIVNEVIKYNWDERLIVTGPLIMEWYNMAGKLKQSKLHKATNK